MPSGSSNVIFTAGGVGSVPQDAAYSGASYRLTYDSSTGIPTPNPLDIVVATADWQTGYNTYPTASSTTTAHVFSVPPSPPVSVNDVLYYTPNYHISPSFRFVWSGYASDTVHDIYSANFYQFGSAKNTWSPTMAITERSDYPWGSDVYFYTRADGFYALKITNGWRGKMNVVYANLATGGYAGKAGLLVSAEGFYPYPATPVLTPPTVKYWARLSVGGTDFTPAAYYNSSDVTFIGDSTASTSPQIMRQSDGDYHAYATAADIPDFYPQWGLDFTGLPTSLDVLGQDFSIAVKTDEFFPGYYKSNGRPTQLVSTTNANSVIVDWVAGVHTAIPTDKGIILCGDVFEPASALSLAWWDSAGALNVSSHFAPVSGHGTSEWQTTIKLESAHTLDYGLVYLPSGRVSLRYALTSGSGTGATVAYKQRENMALGSGPLANWSASGPSVSAPRLSSVGRDDTGLAFAFIAYSGGGALQFQRCLDEAPADAPGWSYAVNAVSGGVRGPYAGGDWTGSGWGCLYTRDSDGKIFWTFSGDGNNWNTAIDTTMLGTVVGMRRLPSNEMICLIWDVGAGSGTGSGGTNKFFVGRSNDAGTTWAKDAAAIPISVLPALAPTTTTTTGTGSSATTTVTTNASPVLLRNQHTLLICSINSSDAPQFIASVDSGKNWA